MGRRRAAYVRAAMAPLLAVDFHHLKLTARVPGRAWTRPAPLLEIMREWT